MAEGNSSGTVTSSSVWFGYEESRALRLTRVRAKNAVGPRNVEMVVAGARFENDFRELRRRMYAFPPSRRLVGGRMMVERLSVRAKRRARRVDEPIRLRPVAEPPSQTKGYPHDCHGRKVSGSHSDPAVYDRDPRGGSR